MFNKVNRQLREEIGKLLIRGRMLIRVIMCWTSDVHAKNCLVWGNFKSLTYLIQLQHISFFFVSTGVTRVKYSTA